MKEDFNDDNHDDDGDEPFEQEYAKSTFRTEIVALNFFQNPQQ